MKTHLTVLMLLFLASCSSPETNEKSLVCKSSSLPDNKRAVTPAKLHTPNKVDFKFVSKESNYIFQITNHSSRDLSISNFTESISEKYVQDEFCPDEIGIRIFRDGKWLDFKLGPRNYQSWTFLIKPEKTYSFSLNGDFFENFRDFEIKRGERIQLGISGIYSAPFKY